MKLKIFKREELSPEEEARRAKLKELKADLKEAGKEYEQRVNHARKLLSESEKEHERAVKEARSQLDRAQKDHDKAVKAAEKRLADVRASGRRKLGSYKTVTLYEDRIETPDGNCGLSPEVTATVDTAGNLQVNKRVTLTRWAVAGPFALAMRKKEKQDTRELWLLVETPSFASVIQCDVNDAAKVRELAAKITTAGRHAASVEQAREQSISEADRELPRVRGDRGAIERSQENLARVEGETLAIGTARDALEKEEANRGDVARLTQAVAALETEGARDAVSDTPDIDA